MQKAYLRANVIKSVSVLWINGAIKVVIDWEEKKKFNGFE